MNITTAISKTRRNLSKHKKVWAGFLAGWVIGLIPISSIFDGISRLLDTFSRRVLHITNLLFLLLLFVLIAWIILLKNNLEAHKKYLKQLAPGFDVDAQDEYSEIRAEIIKEENL